MKKLRIILSVFAFVLAVGASFAFKSPATTAWFAVHPDTGAVQEYLGPTEPLCQMQNDKFCAAEYPGVSNGQPVGQRIQLIDNAERITAP